MSDEKDILKSVIGNLEAKMTELAEGNKMTNFDLLKICKQIEIGAKASENIIYLPHELLEVAVNLYISKKFCRKIPTHSNENSKILDELEKLENQIPVKSWRSTEQQLFQQLSTPPTVAFLMVKLLNPTPQDLILEPSAGTGSLVVWLKLIGCKLHLNELSKKRRTLLELQSYQPTAYNAEFLDDLLPSEITPDGVLMNPPFSTTAGRVKSKDSNFGFRHLTSAIERLKEGGKLVALFGTDALKKSNKGRRFMKEIGDTYSLKALIDLPKNAYYKFGTSTQVTIICLKKEKPVNSAENAINISCSTLAQVLQFANLFD